ncbi:MAG TPA: F0F1 ATP synthase subunit epsilon [Vicinamibacterales bacterium]|nr:F0F1 ATP synthase subunit epsilon [Vicinamibacterales bacterium]
MAVPPIPARLTLEIVTPDRRLVHEEVDEVQLPGAEGYLGVLPGHAPLLTALQVGVLWYRRGAERVYLAVAFGFAEVLPDRVTVLAQIAERAEEIDVERAAAAKARAERRLARSAADLDFERARIALLKSLVRLQVSAKARTRV